MTQCMRVAATGEDQEFIQCVLISMCVYSVYVRICAAMCLHGGAIRTRRYLSLYLPASTIDSVQLSWSL